jgi:hypothetical protein
VPARYYRRIGRCRGILAPSIPNSADGAILPYQRLSRATSAPIHLRSSFGWSRKRRFHRKLGTRFSDRRRELQPTPTRCPTTQPCTWARTASIRPTGLMARHQRLVDWKRSLHGSGIRVACTASFNAYPHLAWARVANKFPNELEPSGSHGLHCLISGLVFPWLHSGKWLPSIGKPLRDCVWSPRPEERPALHAGRDQDSDQPFNARAEPQRAPRFRRWG